MTYDYLIVGAGMTGASFARTMTDAGKRCLVIDKRLHIAGNCYSFTREGIEVHAFGPHIFHTSNEKIWKFVNRFAEFNGYRHQVVANIKGRIIPLPISLYTLNTIFGITTPEGATAYFESARIPMPREKIVSVEDWCLANIGEELYKLLIRGYTEKHWGRSAKDLPASYIQRLPMRTFFDTRYFSDTYEGIPINGYTRMVANMLRDIEVRLNTDFFAMPSIQELAAKTVYTGPIDQLFDYELGHLQYRSISTIFTQHAVSDYQGAAQINYTDPAIPWTRTIEYKHFVKGPEKPYTIIGTEYPEEYTGANDPSYPINDLRNQQKAMQYIEKAEQLGYIVAGRLGTYRYLDMHQAIGQGIALAEKELQRAMV